ncbi:uncharacterized protein [Diadema setosum]|uniref:uncharacterized protein n=1 Tax=Diadema setosum TaxID=31175 RepID=UPI003B3B9C43
MANHQKVQNDFIEAGATRPPSDPDVKSRPTSTTFEIEIFGSPDDDGDVLASVVDEKEEDRQGMERSTIACIAVVIIVLVIVIVGLVTYFTVTAVKQHAASPGNSSTPSRSDITLSGTALTPSPSDMTDTDDECPVIISRSEWGARSAVDTEPLNTPTPYALIHHTATPACASAYTCQSAVRGIQDFHMDTRGWWDIGYNFLIGGDGNVYEGRGLERKGAHARSYNQYSIGIALIGNYMTSLPSQDALATLGKFLDCLRNQ